MKCFYHSEQDAIGICKSCNKGICHSCAVDVGNGIACRGACEEEVRIINQLVDKNKTVYEKTSSVYSRSALIYLLLAVIFIGIGIKELGTSMAYFLIPAGIVMLLGAGFQYSSSKKLNKD